MNNIKKPISILMFGLALGVSALMSSCTNNDFDTEQFVGDVYLNSFGPCPVARGGELRFIGNGMDQITKVNIPGTDGITDIKKVSSTEIRVDVPQTAEVGYITLIYAGGQIRTKTMVTYSEPISIQSIEPATVKPGNELTINGEYLNLMSQVCFSFLQGTDSVNVYSEDFIEHSREKIRVIVPNRAISGVVMVSDGAELPNVVKSETLLDVVLPAVDAPIDLTDAVPGSTITINGHDLDLVENIEMPNGDNVEFEFDSENSKISFVLPANVTDGPIVAIPASGVRVAIANIGVVVPTELVATPANNLRGGDVITIKGVNMDQVASISFANVADAVEPSTISPTQLTVSFPAMAQSGSAILNLHSGKNVAIDLQTAKPTVSLFTPNPVAAAAPFTIEGVNLDLIVKATFAGGATLDVTNDNATSLELIAPATASSGALTLAMANGETVETPTLNINAPECAYITDVVSEELLAGELFVANIANADKLTAVKVNGTDVQFIINNNSLYISLPSSCGKATVITLVSSNGEIAYTYDVIPATHVELIAYDNGPRDLGTWAGENDGGAFRIYKDVFSGVPAGAQLIFHIASYGDPQIQVNDANWSQMEILQPEPSATTAVFSLTAERLNQILTTEDGWSNTAIVVQGQGTVVNKVTIEYEQSLEEAIWTGEWVCSGWNGNQDLAWGGFDWTSVSAGQTLRFYMTPTVGPSDWWCVSLRHGDSWGQLVDAQSQYDTPADGLLQIQLTADMIADLNANGGLVITGDGYILTKITIE